MSFENIISSHLTRQAARDACQSGEKVIRAGSFANGSFELYKPERCDRYGCIIPHRGQPIITVWHVVKK